MADGIVNSWVGGIDVSAAPGSIAEKF